jgi:ATP-dependent helicase HrpA
MTELYQDLADTLQSCMLAQRPSLERRLRKLKHTPAKDRARHIVRLRMDIQASVARLLQRRQLAPVPTYPADLPVVRNKQAIATAIEKHQIIIVCGETGSGKSTQLPKFCLELGRGTAGMIGHTQPRRIAARSVAARIAEELGSVPGQAVGYKVRFNDRVSDDTYIKLMTDGILLAEIQHDRLLRQYDTLIIDEAHERSLNIDLLLGYLKHILPQRPDLKLIIASATIDPRHFSHHFNAARVIGVTGRGYPVEVRYRPLTADDDDARERDQQQAILEAVDELKRTGEGDILVFLSGEREIRETLEFLSRHSKDAEILPLYARLAATEQDRVFKPHNRRRIVLATNVAETSLTVPGIRYVIDAGTARIKRYSLRSKVQRLTVESISQASAKQRLGRCGRTAPGICIRLYSQADLEARPAFTDPELKRSNLAAVILQMKHLGLGLMESFPFPDPPDCRLVNDGYRLLEMLGAMDSGRNLTQLGHKLARLPLDPRLGRMLLAAKDEHCLREMLIIVSALAAQDPRDRPLDKQQAADEKHRALSDPNSDFLTFVKLWTLIESAKTGQLRRLCKDYFLSLTRVREWQDIHRQLSGMARSLGLHQEQSSNQQTADYAAVHRALLTGLLDQIGYRHEDKEFLGARGLKFLVFPGSGLHARPPKWLMAGELAETSRRYARIVAKINPQWIAQVAAHLVKREHFEPHWQAAAARVVAYERVTLFGLTLIPRRRIDYRRIAPAHAHEIFIREALVEGSYKTKATFYAHNCKLIEQIRELEDRARRRDILVDPDYLYRFYVERVPASISTGAAFEQWLQVAEHDHSLYLTQEQLMRRGAAEVDGRNFPSYLEMAGARLPLMYRFEPGHEEDGVTLTVPLAALNQLDPRRCEWLVPGLLEEKIAALIRGLPKDLRRNFLPIPEFAKACARAISPMDSALTDALATALKRMTGVDIPWDAWREDMLPLYLQLRFRIVDDQQNIVAEGRDLAKLQARLKFAAAAGFQSLSTSGFERSGITDWVFEPLPEAIEIEQHGLRLKGYPALVDEGGSVSLRLVDTPARARYASRAGIRRLYMLRLNEQVKYMRKQLPDMRDLCLLYQGIGSCESLRDELIKTVFNRVFIDDKSLPADKHTFETRLAVGRGQLIGVANTLCRQIKHILAQHHRIQQWLKSHNVNGLQAARGDIESQLSHLVYAGFIERTPARWLAQLPRYLQAVEARLERLAREPLRDERLRREIEPFWRRCVAHMSSAEDDWQQDTEFQTYRWMLEEYRVSLFAQHLRAAVKISSKRLEAQWQAAHCA